MTSQLIVLATLKRINATMVQDANAIMGVTKTKEGESPEAAYLRLVSELLNLVK